MTIQTFPADTKLPDDRWPGVFVFGANEQGIHGAGAARTARDQLHYPEGEHDRLIGQAYGISTKRTWRDQGNLRLIARHIPQLELTIETNAQLIFNITAIGTGYAGFTTREVAPLLQWIATHYTNVRFDSRWQTHLEICTCQHCRIAHRNDGRCHACATSPNVETFEDQCQHFSTT